MAIYLIRLDGFDMLIVELCVFNDGIGIGLTVVFITDLVILEEYILKCGAIYKGLSIDAISLIF